MSDGSPIDLWTDALAKGVAIGCWLDSSAGLPPCTSVSAVWPSITLLQSSPSTALQGMTDPLSLAPSACHLHVVATMMIKTHAGVSFPPKKFFTCLRAKHVPHGCNRLEDIALWHGVVQHAQRCHTNWEHQASNPEISCCMPLYAMQAPPTGRPMSMLHAQGASMSTGSGRTRY